jgi:hypothetical protein
MRQGSPPAKNKKYPERFSALWVSYLKAHLVTKPEIIPPKLPCHFAQKAVYLFTVRKQNSFPFQNLNIKENLT